MSSKQWSGEAELQGLLQELCGHTSVPTSKIKQIVSTCNKYVAEFKMVVYEIERFIKKANNDDKIGGVFVIDSLCRQHSKEREIFAKRFSIRLRETMSFLQKTSSQDKGTLTRLLEEWRKKSVFPPDSLVQILSDFNAAPSSSGALLSPSKGESGGDESSKKRSATSAGLADLSEVKKASRLCPFREGNCPYGEKCRFNHHDNNTLDQYAARLMPPLIANRFPISTQSSINNTTKIIIEPVESFVADASKFKSTTLLTKLVVKERSHQASTQSNDTNISVFDPKYWEKTIIQRLHTAAAQDPAAEAETNDERAMSLLPTSALTFHRKKSTATQGEPLPMMVLMANPVLSAAPLPEYCEISRDSLLELYLANAAATTALTSVSSSTSV